MANVIAEPCVGVEDTVASTSRKSPPKKKAGATNGRSLVLSLIKHPGDPVLDVGTGDCACVASILASRGMRVVAVDKDHETILYARMFLNAQRVKKTVRLLQDDISASGLASSSFRNIVCFNVLHHVSRFDSALDELSRILTTDGRVIISEYDENRDGFLERLEPAVGRRFRSVTAYRQPGGHLVLTCEN